MLGGGNSVGFSLAHAERFGEGKKGAESPCLCGKGRVRAAGACELMTHGQDL